MNMPEHPRMQAIRANLAALAREGTLNDAGATGDLKWLLAEYDHVLEQARLNAQALIRQANRMRRAGLTA